MKKSSKKKSQNIKKKRIMLLGGGVLFLLLLTIIGSFVVNSNKKPYEPYYKLESRSDKIKETSVSGAEAYAWVKVQGTDIDTPVVYRTSDLNKNHGADYLWTSSNYVEGENRKAIYGHNIRNVSSYPDIVNPDHFRFEQLVSFTDFDFAKENLYIAYNDGKEESLYKIYAVTFNNSEDEYGQSYPKEKVSGYIETVRKNSIYDYDVEVDENDTLISLITCTRYFGAYEKTQFKVDARKVRENEKITKYKVETNINYDIIK